MEMDDKIMEGSEWEGEPENVVDVTMEGLNSIHTKQAEISASLPEESGIIGRVAADLFVLLVERRAVDARAAVDVRVSYMELYQEELRDLLEVQTGNKELHIREDDRGNTVVVVARETVITSAEELLSVLEAGNALRHTGPTQMNECSSRSHAIVTLQLMQHHHDNGSLRSSKLHLVDLSGSERAARTGNTGLRLKESVHINTGLLALGNVIRALSNPHRRHNHVPYRDAKITRILRDSLGGSAHTLMVACVSPSHHSVAETLSVLQFASRARYVKNQPALCPARACPGWQPGEAHVGELEQEVQTLRKALREKDKTGRGIALSDSTKQATQEERDDRGAALVEESQYCCLAQDAAFQSSTRRDESQQITILQLRRELKNCQDTLAIDKQVFDLRESELEQVQRQKEQLVEQQLLIDRLCGDLLTFRMGSFRPSLDTGASGKCKERRERRSQTVTLLRLKKAETQSRVSLQTSGSSNLHKNKSERRVWLEHEEERAMHRRRGLQELELRCREEVLQHREAGVQERNQLQIKRLRSSQTLSQDLLRVSARLGDLDEELEERGGVERRLSSSAAGLCGVSAEELLKERESLHRRRDTLDTQLRDGRVLMPEEEHALLQSEEVLEALDAAVEFKNYSIQERQRDLGDTSGTSGELQLSLPEASALLVKYFNQVLCLRELERRLQLHCEELQLQSGEQEAVTREMEAALQRLTLDTDLRLTEQHHEHQHNIQILMQQLQEGGSGDSGQAVQARLQQLERDLSQLVTDSLRPQAPDLQTQGRKAASDGALDSPSPQIPRVELAPVRLSHRELRQISPSAFCSTRRHSTLRASRGSFQEDSIVVP
ncbi:kinesin-like protein kif7 [Salvelinus namaycush]|uniref:Kinesin-like protein kif7 n=1 Tax=Salvelinus namaycush TaxID=8040 RepID=A0A8U1F5B8_SALNM|nr:kinesin-like protein kif7 [Salvelinus namaycush]